MSKIPRHRIENFSYSSTRHIRGVPVVKNINYEIVEGKTITGDAPKCFIRLYDKELNVGVDEIRRVEVPLFFFKRNKKRWPLYIVKTGHKGSRPKIGWENEQNINHFKLIEKIVGSSFYISREEIITLFSRSTIERMFETIDSKFVYIMSPVRRDMIKHCIEYRYNKIWDIIC